MTHDVVVLTEKAPNQVGGHVLGVFDSHATAREYVDENFNGHNDWNLVGVHAFVSYHNGYALTSQLYEVKRSKAANQVNGENK